MPIDNAEKRRSVGGVPFLPLGVNVTPNTLKDQEWRQQVSWSYSGILAAGPPTPAAGVPLLVPLPVWPWAQVSGFSLPGEGINTLDAATEYIDFIGQVYWEGEATSKTLSSAGGDIVLRFGTNTFANGATNLRIGIQDIDTTTGPPGRGDGTHDVFADLVGGVDTITANALRDTAMESGSKTLAHGQFVAVRIEMTARGGADTVVVSTVTVAAEPAFPAVTQNFSGVGVLLVAQAIPNVLLRADDGTIGWLQGAPLVETITAQAFDSTTSPDEYGSLIQFPFECAVIGMVFATQFSSSGGIARATLYSDPLGTPVAERTTDVDTNQINTVSNVGAGQVSILFSSPYTVPMNTPFALTIQPQDANSDTIIYEFNMGSAVAGRMTPYQSMAGIWSKGTRTNATGAVTEDANAIMLCGPLLSHITMETGTASTIFVGTNYAQVFPDRGMVKSGSR